MGNVMGIIFANSHDESVHELTTVRTMGSVPFGGRYRMIDFPLSNMVNSGITTVGVITRSNYLSLLDHLKSGREWDLLRKDGGLRVLPPFSRAGTGMYRGSMEALAGAIGFIRETKAEYVVMSDCDIVANIDYRSIVESHIKSGADITSVYFKESCTGPALKNKTVYNLGGDGRIEEMLINPELPGVGEREYNISADMYVIKKALLEDIILEASAKNFLSFEVDVLQKKLSDMVIKGYEFDGIYEHIDTILGYFNSNMNMLDPQKRKKIFLPEAPIYTKVRDEVPVKYGLDSKVKNSLIADGCIIEGEVENCILFRGVTIGKGASVKNSIIMQGTSIGQGSTVNYTITDKDVTIEENRSLQGSDKYPVYINKGATV